MIEKTDLMPYERKYVGERRGVAHQKRRGAYPYITKNMIILNLLGLIFGRTLILDGLAPFGIAFFAMLLSKDSKYRFTGFMVMLGIMTTTAEISWLKYGIALLVCFGVFSVFRTRIGTETLNVAILGGIGMLVAGMIHLIITDFYAYDMFMLGFESVVVFVFIYILAYAVPVVVQKTNRKVLSNEELICIAITVAVSISGFSDIGFMGYSFKNIAGILLTLIFAFNGGASVGAAVGVTIGIITSMSSIGTPTVIGVYAFSGLLAGIFKDLGKMGSAVGMILGNAILTFYINGSTEVIIQFEEILTAFGLFMLMPKMVMEYMEKFVNATASMMQMDKAYSDRIKRLTYERLKEYSNGFSQLAATYGQIAEKNKVVDQQEMADIVNQVANKICKKCGMCRNCWNNNFYSTYHGVVDMIGQLETAGKLHDANMPEAIKKRCIKPDSFIQTVIDRFEIYKIHYQWQKKLFDTRQVIADQFRGISDSIQSLASEVNTEVHFKTEVEDALYVAFDKEKVGVNKVTVLEKDNGKFEIDIIKRPCYERKQCDEKIGPIVSRTLGKEVVRKNHQCTVGEEGELCRFKLTEAEKYKICTGVARVSKDNDLQCGDSYSLLDLKEGKYMIALSDGMGSGERAAKESEMAITLLEQLMETGFDINTAIETINSILVSKSSDEMFSTIDLSMIDLYTGRLEFVKIGAVPSFIKRKNGGVEVIQSSSLPIGILHSIDIESLGQKLENGDFVIMMSDGIYDAGESLEAKRNWVISALSQIDSKNPQFIADELLERSIKRNGNKVADDMTVLVSRIWEV
ncbi:MAG: stage II sporulation protein E [Bacillota bacterium]